MTRHLRVLLIEDDLDDVLLVEEALRDHTAQPYAVTHTPTLTAAIERLEHDRYDIILLDLSLPDSQGIDTFVELLPCRVGAPIIVLTGLHDNAMALRMMRLGAQGYLVKGRDNLAMLPLAMQYAIEQFHLLQETHLANQWETHARELRRLLATWRGTVSQDGLERFGEISNAWEHDYQALVEHLTEGESAAVAEGVARLAEALDGERVGAGDVVELHVRALDCLCAAASLRQTNRYVDTGQRALIALLGALVQRARAREASMI